MKLTTTKLTSCLFALLTMLPQLSLAQCLQHSDGFVPKGTHTLVREASSGQWAYSPSYTTHKDFELQLRDEFALPDGRKAVAVWIYAPGYDPDCEFDVFAKSDVVLYHSN